MKIITKIINFLIKKFGIAKYVSDGYHTFQELYDHRAWLFICLCNQNPGTAWKARQHSDGTKWDDWFIAGIGKEAGYQITYHLPDSLWNDLDVEYLEKAPDYDGHSSDDVLLRLSHEAKKHVKGA